MANLSFGGWVRVARTLTAQRGFGLKYVTEAEIERVGAQAWNDGRNAYVRKPESDWTDSQFKLWLYTLVHEIGHSTSKRREVFDVLKDKKPEGFLRYVHNVLEDHVQELDLYSDEPVLRKVLAEGRAEFYKFNIDKQTPEDIEQAQAEPAGVTVFAWDASERAPWNNKVRGYDAQLLEPVAGDERVAGWIEKLQAGTYADDIAALPDCWETYEIAERMCREVFDVEPEDCKSQQGDGAEQAGGQGEGQGQGQAGAGETAPGDNNGQEQSSSAPGEGSAGESVPKDGSGDQTGDTLSKTFAKFDYADLLAHSHKSDARSGTPSAERGGGCSIDYEQYFKQGAAGSWDFTPDFENLEVYDCTRDEYPYHDKRMHNGSVPPSMLSKKVGRYMQANSKNRRLHGQKRGKLSNKNLYRMKVPNIGPARERVFSQRIVNPSKDVAVSLGIDLSGSMEDYGKAGAAIAAVTHLHSVLHTALRIPLEISGFSTSGAHGAHVIFQSFAKARRNDQIEDDMRRCMAFNGANRDGEWLVWARERLLKQQAHRHIMLVLSDGQPVHRRAGDVAAYTADVCEQIDADPRIDLYAIGIMSSQVCHFYKHYSVIQNIGELEDKLLTVLRDKIIVNL